MWGKTKFRYPYLLLMMVFFSQYIIAQKTETHREIQLQFVNSVRDTALVLGKEYINDFGEKFTVANIQYYISNIVLFNDEISENFPDQYFLLDQKQPSTLRISLLTGLEKITSIQFMIGVDSLQNVQGVQTGNMDPAKGMYWVWNTGYIMAKLEGHAPIINAPRHAFSLHIGGFDKGRNTSRSISLPTNKNMDHFEIMADINKWFNGIHSLPLKTNFFCHEPGSLAMQYADNYAVMFSLKEHE